MDAKLGKVSDYELGREFGCSHGAVRLRRVELGIAPIPARKFVWTAEHDKLLGTASDGAIGKQLEIASVTKGTWIVSEKPEAAPPPGGWRGRRARALRRR